MVELPGGRDRSARADHHVRRRVSLRQSKPPTSRSALAGRGVLLYYLGCSTGCSPTQLSRSTACSFCLWCSAGLSRGAWLGEEGGGPPPSTFPAPCGGCSSSLAAGFAR